MEEFTRGSEDLSSRLHHEVLTSRMRPLADGVRSFPRLVRDMARELGKQARFEVAGETTGVDRDILDRLEAPLNHLIRNALDHGLEMPEDRRAAGKSPVGTIQLEARHRAGMLQIVLSDDGRGIDLERLRTKVVERGLTTVAMAARLSEAELLDFLFFPGSRPRSTSPRSPAAASASTWSTTWCRRSEASSRSTAEPARERDSCSSCRSRSRSSVPCWLRLPASRTPSP